MRENPVSTPTQTIFPPMPLACFADELVVAMDLARFVNPKKPCGLYLDLHRPDAKDEQFRLALRYKRGKIETTLASLTYRFGDDNRTALISPRQIPKPLREKLGAILGAKPSDDVTQDQARRFIFEMFDHVKHHGNRHA